ncbi:MAG: cupin domain-containing protein [Candidatus Gastranaerophilales bacterium]|nr:cupin domain-containing protein [Candidatus Gastranaerophilales bacterium]
MENIKNVEIGKLNEIGQNFENGKVFLKEALELTSCEISINTVPKGFKVPFNHKHRQNEEIYIILKGEGVITIDGSKFPAREGSCIKIAPKSLRAIENVGDDKLQFICIQAKEGSLEYFGLSDAELG